MKCFKDGEGHINGRKYSDTQRRSSELKVGLGMFDRPKVASFSRALAIWQCCQGCERFPASFPIKQARWAVLFCLTQASRLGPRPVAHGNLLLHGSTPLPWLPPSFFR